MSTLELLPANVLESELKVSQNKNHIINSDFNYNNSAEIFCLYGKPGAGKHSILHKFSYNPEYELFFPEKNPSFYDFINKIRKSTKFIILSNFPYDLESYNNLKKYISGVIFIDINDDTAERRLLNRRVHIPSDRRYNLLTLQSQKPMYDDITHQRLNLLKQDNITSIMIRLEEWEITYSDLLSKIEEKRLINNSLPLHTQIDMFSEYVEANKLQKEIAQIDQSIDKSIRINKDLDDKLKQESNQREELELQYMENRKIYHNMDPSTLKSFKETTQFDIEIILIKTSFYYGTTLYRILKVTSLHLEQSEDKCFYYHLMRLGSAPVEEGGQTLLKFYYNSSLYTIKGNNNIIYLIYDYINDDCTHQEFINYLTEINKNSTYKYTKKSTNKDIKVSITNFDKMNSTIATSNKDLIKLKMKDFDRVTNNNKNLRNKMHELKNKMQTLIDSHYIKCNLDKINKNNEDLKNTKDQMKNNLDDLKNSNIETMKLLEEKRKEKNPIFEECNRYESEMKELNLQLKQENKELLEAEAEYEQITGFKNITAEDEVEEEVTDDGVMVERGGRRGRTMSIDFLANKDETEQYMQTIKN